MLTFEVILAFHHISTQSFIMTALANYFLQLTLF